MYFKLRGVKNTNLPSLLVGKEDGERRREGEDGGDAASTKIKSSYEKCEESAGAARSHANELLQGWPVITVEWEVVRNVRVRIGEWVK